LKSSIVANRCGCQLDAQVPAMRISTDVANRYCRVLVELSSASGAPIAT
jgi:hypothetical protein